MSGRSKSLKNPITKSYFVRGVEKMINTNFKDPHLFRVVSNLLQYRVGEDPFIFAQRNDIIPEAVEVYFNNEYLCELNAHMRPDEALAYLQYALIEKLKVKANNGNPNSSSR